MTQVLRHHRSKRHGFSLAEVILSVAVFVALALVAVPVSRSIRASAASTRTMEHLRRIQSANIIHARENDGFFVGNAPFADGDMWSRPWFSYGPFVALLGEQSINGELPDAWTNGYPETLKCGPAVAVDAPPRHDRNFTIAMNMTGWTHHQDGTPVSSRYEWFGFWNPGKLLQSRIKNPSRFIMFYESGTFTGYMYDRLDWKGDIPPHPRGMAFRNKGGRCHVVFADGHVGSLVRTDVEKDDDTTRRYFWWDADTSPPAGGNR